MFQLIALSLQTGSSTSLVEGKTCNEDVRAFRIVHFSKMQFIANDSIDCFVFADGFVNKSC